MNAAAISEGDEGAGHYMTWHGSTDSIRERGVIHSLACHLQRLDNEQAERAKSQESLLITPKEKAQVTRWVRARPALAIGNSPVSRRGGEGVIF